MRFRTFLLLGVVLAAGGWYLLETKPVWLQPAAAAAQAWFYEKRVVFTGLELLDEEELRTQLPWDKSVPWWLCKTGAVVSKLRHNPFIGQVELSRCGRFSWGCFTVFVRERRPELVALVGAQVWLVGEDGGYLAPLPLKREGIKMLRGEGLWKIADVRLPIVEGVSGADASPDATKVRYQFVSKAIRAFEEEGDYQVERVRLESNGELEVKLRGLDFGVHCDVPRDNFDLLKEQIQRLKALLTEFKGDYRRIESIDLAFKKVGVVKLREPDGAEH